ncbi:TPA: hypothetical protein ACHKZ7_003495 [Escherichia coli]|nr:transposase [Escherichia coli]EHW4768213.1 hypothetical protein [Escherichia coli]
MLTPDNVFLVVKPVDMRRGSFRWPRKGDATWHLTQDEFHWLVFGVDWQQVKGHDLAKWVYQEEPEDAQSNAITQ